MKPMSKERLRHLQYAHMCRDGHIQIGHNDSEHEMCPLCIAIAQRDELAEALCILLKEAPSSRELKVLAGPKPRRYPIGTATDAEILQARAALERAGR